MIRQLATAFSLLVAAGSSSTAAAKPATETQERASEGEAPPPEAARGVRESPPPSAWRRIPRALLLVPRGVIAVAFAPARLAMWTYSRFRLRDRFYRVFFNDEGTIGIYPAVSYESGLGVHAGARFVHRDLGGDGSRLSLHAGAGGEDELVAAVGLSTGERLGDTVEVSLVAGYQSRRRSRFFGYGNGDLEDPSPGSAIDPVADDTAVATRYAYRDVTAELDVLGRVAPSLWAHARVSYRDHEPLGDIDPLDVPITDVYDPVRIPGFTGIQPLAANLELIFDTRATRSHLLSGAAPSSGWRLAARGGYQLDFGDNSSRFWRYGADLRRHIDLYRGDRVVVLGAAFDGVAGDITEVPFVDLPTLGGKHRLRGYAGGRFRDRLAAVTSAEYRYPVSRNALGFLAVDAGRVWREPGDIDIDVDDLRVGFGGGLQLHSHRSFVARLSLFTSIDGGIEASVVFDPVVPGRRRTAR